MKLFLILCQHFLRISPNIPSFDMTISFDNDNFHFILSLQPEEDNKINESYPEKYSNLLIHVRKYHWQGFFFKAMTDTSHGIEY